MEKKGNVNMTKVFKSKEFIQRLKWLVNDVPNYYHSEGGTWCNYNWNNNKFMMDCVVSIKGLLWGFKADKNLPHGGGIYGSNGVADFTPDGGLNYCTDVSQDFSNLIPGEYLCMKGTGHSHAGVYLGNGKVFECTVAWNTNRCIISDISNDGTRSFYGVKSLKWTYHGKLNYIDYSDTPKPADDKVNVYYRVKTVKHGWLPEVKNLEDYAGYEDSPITDVAIRVDKGSIKYRVSPLNKDFLPYVTGCDINDFNNGYAGNGTPIDRIEVYYYTPSDIRPYKKAKYRVNNYPWQYDNEKTNGQDGYAGARGVNITKFQIVIE